MVVAPTGQDIRRGFGSHGGGLSRRRRDHGRARPARSGVADEGGWWPAFSSNEEALDTLMRAIERAGFTPGEEVAISLDVAASEFGRGGRYRLGLENRELDPDGMAEMLLGWCARYPIVSIEDPLRRGRRGNAPVHRGRRRPRPGDRRRLSSSPTPARATRGAGRGLNAVLVKVNQAGTVSEARAASRRAAVAASEHRLGPVRRNGGRAIVHLAIGWSAGQLKVGSFSRSERMAKWNEALRIEEASGRGRALPD